MSTLDLSPLARRIGVVIAALVAIWSSSPRPASAQAVPAARKKKIIRLDEIQVEGRIQKPQAFYILPRSSLNYEGSQGTEPLAPKVVRSTDGDPF